MNDTKVKQKDKGLPDYKKESRFGGFYSTYTVKVPSKRTKRTKRQKKPIYNQ